MSNPTAEDWKNRIKIRRNGQMEKASYYRFGNKVVGIPTIIVSSIVASAVFGTLGSADSVKLQIAAGALSLLAVILSAVQTFLGYDSLAEQSKFSASRYSALLRKLERHIASNPINMDDTFMKDFVDEWDIVDKDAPPLPKSSRTELEL